MGEASRYAIKTIRGSLASLRTDVKSVEAQLAHVPATDKLIEIMRPFVESAQAQLARLAPELESLETEYGELLVLFCEKSMPSDEFFALLNSFKQDYELARKQNIQEREKEAMRVRKARHKMQMGAKRAAKKAIEKKLGA